MTKNEYDYSIQKAAKKAAKPQKKSPPKTRRGFFYAWPFGGPKGVEGVGSYPP